MTEQEKPAESQNLPNNSNDIEFEIPLGKLKKTLNKKCPQCGHVLQLRTFDIKCVEEGIDVVKYKDYIMCTNCDYEQDVKPKRKRYKDKEKQVEEEFDNGRYNKSKSAKKNNAGHSGRGNRTGKF